MNTEDLIFEQLYRWGFAFASIFFLSISIHEIYRHQQMSSGNEPLHPQKGIFHTLFGSASNITFWAFIFTCQILNLDSHRSVAISLGLGTLSLIFSLLKISRASKNTL